MVKRALAMRFGATDMYHLARYTSEKRDEWDTFVQSSKNGTFLFLRDYMEYHRDRYSDHSLMFYKKGKLLAILPAHQAGTRFDSHGGLTYGGFVTDEQIKLGSLIDLFGLLFDYLRESDFQELRYKVIPHIYHVLPADEDQYILHQLGAQLTQRSASLVLQPNQHPPFQKLRQRGIKKAIKAGVVLEQTEDWSTYWALLEQMLKSAHDSKPVHSLSEMMQLQQMFKANIKLYAAYQDGEMVAGVVIYETPLVTRFQYIAASDVGKNIGALDYLFSDLIGDVYRQKRYIDFGTSQDDRSVNGLNMGLVSQKEGFGARTVVQDQYLMTLSKIRLEMFK